ncbi:hypothetical protein CEXT_530621 [Caerostris extrusa]|uniref:Uncharacterized protein n=1 Tax=Caerostris extrusa TaxID=172846 RepID=A0AAV4PBZ0_CAEEX|nr:hypothetical protein CEXT_530621 [Caerostris extrusa]
MLKYTKRTLNRNSIQIILAKEEIERNRQLKSFDGQTFLFKPTPTFHCVNLIHLRGSRESVFKKYIYYIYPPSIKDPVRSFRGKCFSRFPWPPLFLFSQNLFSTCLAKKSQSFGKRDLG